MTCTVSYVADKYYLGYIKITNKSCFGAYNNMTITDKQMYTSTCCTQVVQLQSTIGKEPKRRCNYDIKSSKARCGIKIHLFEQYMWVHVYLVPDKRHVEFSMQPILQMNNHFNEQDNSNVYVSKANLHHLAYLWNLSYYGTYFR